MPESNNYRGKAVNGSECCMICNLKDGESIMADAFAPTLCWLKTSKINGLIQMQFGYGDDFEHLYYYPKYCPECGRKVERNG